MMHVQPSAYWNVRRAIYAVKLFLPNDNTISCCAGLWEAIILSCCPSCGVRRDKPHLVHRYGAMPSGWAAGRLVSKCHM
uniref:Transposase n=1 Tax=Ralstonia syzygii R24 TaxID=907261 RepID=G3AC84_9RALS|nr:hypothetical protein RALSY_mp30483 [Ralstonia syzygii R24]